MMPAESHSRSSAETRSKRPSNQTTGGAGQTPDESAKRGTFDPDHLIKTVIALLLDTLRLYNGKLYNLRTDEFTSGHSDVRSVPVAYAIMRGMETNDAS
jgi:hypothetical protein